MSEPIIETQADESDSDDAIVCFCYRLTAKQLKAAHAKHGSLKVVQQETRAGMGCGGCRIALQALFSEQLDDINRIDRPLAAGTSCSKPGNRVMKGFIISNGELESTVYSSNGVAPQLGDCDSTMPIDYSLLDAKGKCVLKQQKLIRTNETFIFETKDLDLPRPFYGMFIMNLGRSNFGAARFNVCWANQYGRTSTHENSSTGRPLITLPAIFDRSAVNDANEVYFALLNPHEQVNPYIVSAFDVDTNETFTWESRLEKFETAWLNASEHLLRPALERKPNGRFALRIATTTLGQQSAITVYFLFHNKKTGIWTSNHL